jgi:hypothetical protein
MKKIHFLQFAILVVAMFLFNNIIKAQTAYWYTMEMSDSLDTWTKYPGQKIVLKDRKEYSTNVTIFNKCKSHRGATGKFVVEFHNNGPKSFVGYVMLMPDENTKYKWEPNNGVRVSLDKGEKVSYYMELRGCFSRAKDDLEKCRSCKPKLVFFDLNVL